jgi:hypothetical protein
MFARAPTRSQQTRTIASLVKGRLIQSFTATK